MHNTELQGLCQIGAWFYKDVSSKPILYIDIFLEP
jgi:hypothetical protein